MLPIIIICGTPHSLTSMTSRFLQDNGGFCGDNWDDPKYTNLEYTRYESKAMQEFVTARKNFRSYDLRPYFDSLPKDQVATLKEPLALNFLNELQQFTDRPVKAVFVLRNPQDVVLSSMEKQQKSFIYVFERLVNNYHAMVEANIPVFPLVAERLLKRDEQYVRYLIDFCELPAEKINFEGIEQRAVKSRKTNYAKFRFSNFLWKRLARHFVVYEEGDKK